jgi:hypothetical protein
VCGTLSEGLYFGSDDPCSYGNLWLSVADQPASQVVGLAEVADMPESLSK